jgi:hypothetical protein
LQVLRRQFLEGPSRDNLNDLTKRKQAQAL